MSVDFVESNDFFDGFVFFAFPSPKVANAPKAVIASNKTMADFLQSIFIIEELVFTCRQI